MRSRYREDGRGNDATRYVSCNTVVTSAGSLEVMQVRHRTIDRSLFRKDATCRGIEHEKLLATRGKIKVCNFKELEAKRLQDVCRVLRQSYRAFKQGC